jgi:RNA polymerase sigma factor (sigma-70 family)
MVDMSLEDVVAAGKNGKKPAPAGQIQVEAQRGQSRSNDMVTSTLNPVLDQLRRTVLLRDGANLTDRQLLESFVRQKDEGAFAVLVRRHAPMVLGVCRRVLRNSHDAEDAFQAVFLVLARKAESIVPREMIANWLYGVAYRTALKARTMTARRRARERQVTAMPEPETSAADTGWRELQTLLDQELSCLPDKYRVPIVLCCLEGKSGKDAARQLGWPEGTVASRLSRGRELLAKRLIRHGLALSAGSLAAVLSEKAASAAVPASLVSTTIKAASLLAAGQALTTGLVSAQVGALAEGVVYAMFLTKLKTGLVLFLALGVLGAGLGLALTSRTAAEGPAPRGAEANSDKGRPQGARQQDGKQDEKPGQGNAIPSSDDLRGKWTGEKNGIKVELTFHGEQARWQAHWQVEFQKTPTKGVTIGADLKGDADRKAGCLNLYLPKYLGNAKELKQNPSFNGLRPVGQVQRGAEGTIQLRIIPTGCEHPDYDDYPVVEDLILRRVREP